MKVSKAVTLVTIVLIAGFAAAGCKKKPVRPTVLPGQGVTRVGSDGAGTGPTGGGIGANPTNPLEGGPTSLKPNDDGTTPASRRSLEGRTQDRDKFKAHTVFFDFDQAVVKTSEASKADAVAGEFKKCDPESDLLIEGHCDERGTPEYNRALGERRAAALREYLIRAGVNADHVHTVSFGEDKPAALGHDEASWSKNRRGEFIFVLPK